MSQVIRAITAVDTGNRQNIKKELTPIMVDVFKVKQEWTTFHDPAVGPAKIYRIDCRLGAQVMVEESGTLRHAGEQESGQELADAVHRTKQMVIEAIFGEFRSHFRQIEKSMYDYDYKTARTQLYAMERQMFDTE